MEKSYKPADSRENPCYVAFERVEDIPEVSLTDPAASLGESKLD